MVGSFGQKRHQTGKPIFLNKCYWIGFNNPLWNIYCRVPRSKRDAVSEGSGEVDDDYDNIYDDDDDEKYDFN